MYDMVIIGAGVSGCAIARELARYCGKICVLERGEDVCTGTSKANSGIIHAGHDARHGTMKARLNVRGNEMMDQAARELDIPFIRNGSLVVCTDEKQMPELERLHENGTANGVPGLRIISGHELRQMEPNLSGTAVAALYAPTGGIVCPFELNIALAENACMNGVEFIFHAKVDRIRRRPGGYEVHTESGMSYEGRTVVNAAGVYADQIHNMACTSPLKIGPRKGEYMLLDKAAGSHVQRTIFTLPGPYGKGVLVTPTVHGNLLVGPTALDIQDKEGIQTTREGLAKIKEQYDRAVKDIPLNQVITAFAGLRAHEKSGDFIIREAEEGFYDCAGIASPGLSSCLAIGELVAGMVEERLKLPENKAYVARREGIVRPGQLSVDKRDAWIRKNPAYGNIICRCEMISEGEIIDAIRRPLGARTMDGIKRRTRAGMGRCQSGFCSPKVMEILAREWNMDLLEVRKASDKSWMLLGQDKEEL